MSKGNHLWTVSKDSLNSNSPLAAPVRPLAPLASGVDDGHSTVPVVDPKSQHRRVTSDPGPTQSTSAGSTSGNTGGNAVHPAVNGSTPPGSNDNDLADGIVEDIEDILDKINPAQLIAKIPDMGKHRFLLNIAKYPGIADIICGVYVMWVHHSTLTDLQMALSIIAIICGGYTFAVWLFGQINFHMSWKAATQAMVTKIVHMIGGILLALGNVAVAILVIRELKGAGDTCIFDCTTLASHLVNLDESSSDASTTAGPDISEATFDYDALLAIVCVLLGLGLLIFSLMTFSLFYGVRSIRAMRRHMRHIEAQKAARAQSNVNRVGMSRTQADVTKY